MQRLPLPTSPQLMEGLIFSAMGKIVGSTIDKFQQWFFEEHEGTEESWKGDYWKVLKHLPRTYPLSRPALVKWIRSYAPEKNSKKRKRACMVIRVMLREIEGLDFDTAKLEGDYASIGPDPRSIPSEKRIVQVWQELDHNRGWQWVFAALAVYGLRPHEPFRLDFDLLRKGHHRAHILDGKTGERYAMPYHPEWFHDFALHRVQLPSINIDRTNEAVSRSCSHYLNSKRMGFTPLALRHAYAIRLMRDYNVQDYWAARWMGHGVEVHRRDYWRWIDERESNREFKRSLKRREEPVVPRPFEW